jgi:hypothetical protein
MEKFYWGGFTENDFKQYCDNVDVLGEDWFVGAVRIGDLCFDLVTRDFGDGGITLTYDLYIGGVNDGYGCKNGHPYTYGDGGSFRGSCTDMTYEEFTAYAEGVLSEFIAGCKPTDDYNVQSKADEPLCIW